MAEPFLSEIRLFSFAFPPKGWARCDGQLLPINTNQALFSLLGTTYGGNGQTNFALPNLRGRVPVHEGAGLTLGQQAGVEAVTINIQQLPQHLHLVNAVSANASTPIPTGNTVAAANNVYGPAAGLAAVQPATVLNTGGSQAHTNMAPYLVLNYCIALQGIFPSQN